MKAQDEKILMAEIATLYYNKKLTQQEIADLMHLSRQTVSKLLNEALEKNVVQITICNPEKDRKDLEAAICEKFGIQSCVVCSVSSENESLRRMMTVKAAADHIAPILQLGGLKIALSWGRTIQEFINNLPQLNTQGNTVFPLFGATDNENAYFSSNELARGMADQIGATVKYAWFPYLADTNEDCALLKTLSYFKKMESLWANTDIAIVGIGNQEILQVFGKTFGYRDKSGEIIGDVATHFFNEKGQLIDLYENTLCASAQHISGAKKTIAIACGNDKVTAIAGALRTQLINTLITDEYTARQILEQ
ncbi:MAG: winged helix-turn-helix transcriptional regulator [Oscillospiraceae bacterium]|nr:winged helix-turn-helix transcriptional regulator [Oscillospiraceae bacterium]